MAKRRDSEGPTLLAMLHEDPAARLVASDDGGYRLAGTSTGRKMQVPAPCVRSLLSAGLLHEREPGVFGPTAEAASWLKRQRGGDRPFRRQHGEVVTRASRESPHTETLVELDESPVAALSRKIGKNGVPWLAAHALAASERLRRDFEIGGLQPRVTANWSASVSDGRRDGVRGGIADLTDMALAARLRFDRAVAAVGPEFSGVLVDVCCFLKGLETVERERQWPARAAKLVLRLGLESLARHYGLTATATGRQSGKLRHWGAEDYRPEIT